MEFVKLSADGQLSVPEHIRKQLRVESGDVFEMDVTGNEIHLKLQAKVQTGVSENIKKPGVNIRDYIGSGRGLFNSPKDVDDFLNKERNSWD